MTQKTRSTEGRSITSRVDNWLFNTASLSPLAAWYSSNPSRAGLVLGLVLTILNIPAVWLVGRKLFPGLIAVEHLPVVLANGAMVGLFVGGLLGLYNHQRGGSLGWLILALLTLCSLPWICLGTLALAGFG